MDIVSCCWRVPWGGSYVCKISEDEEVSLLEELSKLMEEKDEGALSLSQSSWAKTFSYIDSGIIVVLVVESCDREPQLPLPNHPWPDKPWKGYEHHTSQKGSDMSQHNPSSPTRHSTKAMWHGSWIVPELPNLNFLPDPRTNESCWNEESEEHAHDNHMHKPDPCWAIMRGNLCAETNSIELKWSTPREASHYNTRTMQGDLCAKPNTIKLKWTTVGEASH